MRAAETLHQCRVIFADQPQPRASAGFQDHELSAEVWRWLMHQGWIEHVQADTGERIDSLLFAEESHFALTETGARVVDDFERLPNISAPIPNTLPPRYNQEEHVLYWGCHIIKDFTQLSDNQELILLSGEELQWPEWFDDPLPHTAGTNPKIVLKQTVRDLNRYQARSYIHFKTKRGQQVGWEYR